MSGGEIFGEAFEELWSDFDSRFRAELLERIQELGSLYRLKLTRDEFGDQLGLRFYEALETTLVASGVLERMKESLTLPLPESFDDLLEVFAENESSPLHAFFLLLIYLSEHPFRAFFSGRDEELPFNTLSVSVFQSPGAKLPEDVTYALTAALPELCPASVFDVALRGKDKGKKGDKKDDKKKDDKKDDETEPEHPRNHFFWKPGDPDRPGIIIWVWHF
jgi:hypothetical protein